MTTTRRNVTLGSVEREVFIRVPADHALELIEPRARPDRDQSVIAVNDGRVGGGVRFPVVTHARDGDTRLDATGNAPERHAVEVRVGDDERPPLERLGFAPSLGRELLRLALDVRRERAA